MTASILLIAIGIVFLAGGGEILLRGAVALAKRLNLTPAVIGLTVVAAGTSVPELAVSIIASFKGSADIAVANVVGSNIANTALILGLASVIIPLSVTGTVIRLEYPVMVLVSLLFLVLIDDRVISRLDALLLMGTEIAFTAYMLALVKDKLAPEESRDIENEVAELSNSSDQSPAGLKKALILVGLGAGALAIGAQLTVEGAVEIGRTFNISERVIGLTIVAIGTSLPEIVTSLVAAARGRDDVAIGNVIGSNLFNILGILGLSAFIHPLQVSEQIKSYDVYWMLGTALVLFPMMRSKLKLNRAEGALLLAIYSVYLWTLI